MLIEVSPEDLAGCRFAISPLSETTSALRLVAGVDTPGVLTPWVRRMRPRLAPLRRAEPAVGALISLFRRDDNADFLHPAPTGPRVSFAGELSVVRATPLRRARRELARNLAGHRTPPAYAQRILDAPNVVARLADAVQATWTTLIEPEWPRLRAVLERDIVQRSGRLTAYGWSAALDGLHPRVSWTPPSAITIRHRVTGTYGLSGRGLQFVPSIFGDLVIGMESPGPFTLGYRARGVADVLSPPPFTRSAATRPGRSAAAGSGRSSAAGSGRSFAAGSGRSAVSVGHDALGPLLGAGRAAILRALAAPATTSQLVEHLGLSLGTVGGHLAVLHAAGLVSRARTGRSVNYVATPLGDALLSPDAPR